MIRDVTFLTPQLFDSWSQAKTAGTITLSNANRTATINNSDALRTYLYLNANVTANHWYYFSVYVDSAAAEFDTTTYGDAQLMIYEGVAGGQQFYPITSADNGRRVGILFQALSTKSERFRVGVGAVSNREAGELVISDPVVYSYGATQPALVDKFYYVGAQTFPYTIQTSKAAASVYAAGVVTENAATETTVDPSQVILCTGDSYGLNQRYPYYLQIETGGIVYNRHIGGENLAEILARLPGDLAGDFYPADMLELYSPPKTLIMEGGGNSALENVDSTAILDLMDDCLDIAVAAGVQRIVIVNLPPFLNYASYTESKAYKALKYNELLGSKYRNYPVYDLYNAMKGDVAAGDTFEASGASWTMHPLSKIAAGDTYDYDSGDGLHPSQAASEKIAEELAFVLRNYPLQSIRRSGVLSVPTGYPYTPHFKISRSLAGVTENFSPEDYMVPSAVTYYFSPTGNDANSGLTDLLPKRKVSLVVTALNASPPAGATFILAPGIYGGTDGFGTTSMQFDCNVICESGRAEFAFRDTVTWTKTAGRTNVYQSSTTRTNPAVIDLASTDSYGIAKRLKLVADLATCDATPGSTLTVSTTLYVHAHDSRAADADIVAFSTAISGWTQSNSKQFYVKNVDFWGYLQPVLIGGSAAARFVFDGCTYNYSYATKNGFETASSVHADTLVIHHNCTAAYNSYDGFGYRGAHTAIEIDCKGVYNGFIGTNDADNGSTAHENVTTLRINGIYRYNGDRNVHDVNNTFNWLIGCKAGNAQNGSVDEYISGNFTAGIQGTGTDDPHTWLEACESYGGSASDAGSYGGSIVDTLDCVGFVVTDVEGTALLRDAQVGVWPNNSQRALIGSLFGSLISNLIN